MNDRRIHGEPLDRDLTCAPPARAVLAGETVQLEPIDPGRHAAALFQASHGSPETEELWRYMPAGPFADRAAFGDWLARSAVVADPLPFAIRDVAGGGKTGGMASFMRIKPAHGVIEIGGIWFAPALQGTRQSTEALFLMMDHALTDLGYRRLEWKCDALSKHSRAAALRLGFRFDGIFHRHMIIKGRNRDTAWFSIVDEEWPALRRSFTAWLAASNFEADGGQRRRLGYFR